MYSFDEDEIVILPEPVAPIVGADEEAFERIPDEDFLRDQAQAAQHFEMMEQLNRRIRVSVIAEEHRDRTFGHGFSPEELEAEREKERQRWRQRHGKVPSWLSGSDEKDEPEDSDD